MLKFKKLQKN